MIFIANVSFQTWYMNDSDPTKSHKRLHTVEAYDQEDAIEKIEAHYKEKCKPHSIQYTNLEIEISEHIT